MNKRSIIGGRAGSGILLEGGVSNDTKLRRRRLPGLDFNIILNLGGGRCFTPTDAYHAPKVQCAFLI